QVTLVSSAGIVALAAVRAGFSVLQTYLAEQASQDGAYAMRNQLYAKLQALSFSYHDQAQASQLLTRMTSDVDAVRQLVVQGLLQLVGALISIVGTMLILLLMNWRLGLVSIAVIPIVGIVLKRYTGNVRPRLRQQQNLLGQLNGIMDENLTGA